MSARATTSRSERFVLTATALAGTLPIALLSSACIARFLPMSADARYALGFALAIPIWLAGMCVVFAARNVPRACLTCLGITVALAAAVFGIPH